MKRFKTVEDYITYHENWYDALVLLREIIQSTELDETVKWGAPAYTYNGKNVVGLGAFKSYVGIWFFQGVFLKDEKQKLINAQEGKTKALRQWRFASLEEIDNDSELIREYVEEAIFNQKQGKEIKPVKEKKTEPSPELEERLKKDPKLEERFSSLTPAKQREYVEYINEAKRIDTKQKRLEKIVPLILQSIGLNDKYKK